MIGHSIKDQPGRSPLAGTFSAGRERVFLTEDREDWTIDRLLSLAADADRALERDAPGSVAVMSRSAAFVVAALLAAWKRHRAPLLLDPDSRVEGTRLAAVGADVRVLAPAGEGEARDAIHISESGSAPLDPRCPEGREAEVAFLTSGSTGEPKLVLKRAYQLEREFAAGPGWLGCRRPSRVLCLVPPFHILGYIYGIYLPFATGGSTTFLRRRTPQTWVARIAAVEPDLVVGVPSHYRLMNQVLAGPLPPATYLSSGAPLPAPVGESFTRLSGRGIRQVFGSTETGGIAHRDGDGPWIPLPGLEWRIESDTGHFLIRSPWQERPESWCRTDDLAEALGDGFRLMGRTDSVVKVGGQRFSTGEVVEAALAHPSVDQAYALAYGRYGEVAIALFVTAGRGGDLDATSLRTHLAGRLAPFKVPRTVRILEEMPLMGSGKPDAAALRALVSVPEGE